MCVCLSVILYVISNNICDVVGTYTTLRWVDHKSPVINDITLQVFAIEFSDFAIEFVPFAIEFVAFAIEFVPFAIEFVGFAIEFVLFAIEFVSFAIEFVAFAVKFVVTRMAAGANKNGSWSKHET